MAPSFRVMATIALAEKRDWVAPKTENSDDELAVQAFARLATGDRVAVGDFYDLFADELFGLALWLTGRREQAAGVVQEVFVRLLERVGRLRRVRSPRAYLLRMARTVVVDRFRRSRRHEATDPLDERGLFASDQDPLRRLDAERMERRLRRLPVKQRAALYLRFYCDLTYAEIGRALGVPTFTAASRCRLAIRRLRRWAEEEETR